MAANVSESPGQPPGSVSNTSQSPANQTGAGGGQRSSSASTPAPEKNAEDKQSTSNSCNQSSSKRRLESQDAPAEDGSCDSQLESLCRKKFKPIAPKPTVKKDEHQSVVTATVPIKEAAPSEHGGKFGPNKEDGKNGAIMFVSPKVQLVPSVPVLGRAPLTNGDALTPATSPYSVTVPLLPHGKYLNVLNPPVRVSLTDVAGHYKTVVQLLPNGSAGNLVPATKPAEDFLSAASKPAAPKVDQSSYKNGMSSGKNSRSKTASKPKGSRYKYSLLMNGGSYAGSALSAAASEKIPTPQSSLNEGLRLNLPAVLTSQGVLQISVPSVGIANGQVQFCNGLPPAVGLQTQTTVAQTAAAKTIPSAVVAPSSVAKTVAVSTTPPDATSNGVQQVTEARVSDDSLPRPVAAACAPSTNGMSLDGTLRDMLKTPRSTVARDASTLQTRKTKPHRTGGSSATAAKNRSKRHRTPVIPPEGANSEGAAANGRGAVSTQVVEESLPTQRSRVSGSSPDPRNPRGGPAIQNVQYRHVDAENCRPEGLPLPPCQDTAVNQRSPGAIPVLPNYAVNSEGVSLAHPAASTTPACSAPPVLSRQQEMLPSTSALNGSHILANGGLGSRPPPTGGRHSSRSVTVTTSNNVPSSERVGSDQWSRTDMVVTSRASSLPNFAVGPGGLLAGVVTATSITANVSPHQPQQNLRGCVPVPSSMTFNSGAALPPPAPTSSSAVVPSMQVQCPQPNPNVAVTTTNFIPLCESATAMVGIVSRTMATTSTCSNVIARNSHSHLQPSTSMLHDAQQVLVGSAVQPAPTPAEAVVPAGDSLTASRPHQVGIHQDCSANIHTAVTNSAMSVHHGFPTATTSSVSNMPAMPAPPVQHGAFFQEMAGSRIAAVPAKQGVPPAREERGAVPARRQLQLPEDNPGTIHAELNEGIGSLNVAPSGPSADIPHTMPRPPHQELVGQRQTLPPAVPRPSDVIVETAPVPGPRTEQSGFAPPLPVVPHHAGILATAILRSRALERNPWGVPNLNISSSASVLNTHLAASSASTPITSSAYFGVSHTGAVSGSASHAHLTDNVLHLRPPPGVAMSLGRGRDKEATNWPVAPVSIANTNEDDALPGSHPTQLPLERQGRPRPPPVAFNGNADLERAGPDPVTSASIEQAQTIQTVPLHSNIPPNARNAMNEALHRRPRSQRIQASAAPSSVASSQTHPSSVVVSSAHGMGGLTHSQPANPVRQELPAPDPQQPRPDLFPHQHPTPHVHAMPGTRLSSDSVSHLRMPLMGPPSVLYGSSTPMPNLSMTPLHGVPLPGPLSAHSVQGHGMTHQLHATPPPASHRGQSTGPSPQRPVNHMFVPTPYGPIHRSLCMPPPSPHPPDLALMSPRSYGQVHVHDSVLYSPRFSSPIRNLPGASRADGMFGSALPRSFSEERLDNCCSVPYTHSPPMHENSGHVFPAGFMSPIGRSQAPLPTSLCNTLQRPFNHPAHPTAPEARLPNPFFHESSRPPVPQHLQAVLPSTTAVTAPTSLPTTVTQVSVTTLSCNPTQPASIANALLISTVSPATSSTIATTPGSTTSSENLAAAPTTPTSSACSTPVRVFNLGSTSDKYLPLEVVVSPPSTAVSAPSVVTSLPAQLSGEQIVKFGDVILECSRQILRESGRTVLCCWGCDYHTAEPKKMYRHQRRDELPMKCQLCPHVGNSRCKLNQHFKDVHMDKDEDPFRTSAVT